MTVIEKITLNIDNIFLNETIDFNKNLNIICGENGSGKTILLNEIFQCSPDSDYRNYYDLENKSITNKRSTVTYNNIENTVKINHKETTEKLWSSVKLIKDKDEKASFIRNFNQFFLDASIMFFSPTYQENYQFLRCSETNKDNETEVIKTYEKEIIDNIFISPYLYSPFYLNKKEYNHKNLQEIFSKIFPDYILDINKIKNIKENAAENISNIPFFKKNDNELCFSNLSKGERQLLSLAFSLYFCQDKYNICLIDEPENNLNWDLEYNLFNFLDWFSEKYDKQLIIATHSKVAFKEDFINKVKFLVWKDNYIKCVKDLPQSSKERLIGDSINFLTNITLNEKTIFVEDECHKQTILSIIKSLEYSEPINVIQVGNSANVKSLYKLYIPNSLFLIDGDNQNDKNQEAPNWLRLSKYCLENYFLNIDTLSKLFEIKFQEVELLLFQCFEELTFDNKSAPYIKLAKNRNKALFSIMDSFDGSVIITKICKKQQISKNKFIEDFIKKAKEENVLTTIFKEIIEKIFV